MAGAMAVFVGEVHSEALGLNASNDLGVRVGIYEGQMVDLHPESRSMIAAAYEMDDCPTEVLLNRSKLVDIDIKEKKRASQRFVILKDFIERLDKHGGMRQYSDFERKMARLIQQIMLQNPQLASGEGIQNLTYNGENLADYILRNIPFDFDEVTEQHNAIACVKELGRFDSERNGDEIKQCEKILKRLSGKADPKSVERREEFEAKIRALREQINCSYSFNEALANAQKTLERTHGKEIEDGYNLIPKASAVCYEMSGGTRGSMTAVGLAALYRDKLLVCNNFVEVFVVIVSICIVPPNTAGRDGNRAARNQ
jgi:hypothetical protein